MVADRNGMMRGRTRVGWAATSVILAVVAGAFLWPRKVDTHLKALVSTDVRTGCYDDAIRRGELEAAGEAAVPFLRDQLRATPGPVIQALGWLNRTPALPWFRDWISESVADAVSQRLSRPDHAKQQALRALLLLGPAARAARPELIRMSTNSNSWLSGPALAVLTATAPDDPVTVSNALAVLAGNGQMGRLFLAQDFPIIWTRPPAHLDALIARLGDPNDSVRAATARALAVYGIAASNAVPQLLPLLTDRQPTVRPSAAFALGMISPPHASLATQAMLGQQATNPAWTGDIAHRLYAHLGPRAGAAKDPLQAGLTASLAQGFPGPPAFALWRVTGQASPEVILGLTRGAGGPMQRYQLMALTGLREIGPPASNAVPVLRQLLQDPHRTIQRAAAEALDAIVASPR